MGKEMRSPWSWKMFDATLGKEKKKVSKGKKSEGNTTGDHQPITGEEPQPVPVGRKKKKFG